MSRDIFVQDMPDGVTSVEEIPDDWRPRPLRFGSAEVLAAVLELAPDADTTDPTWIHVSLPSVEIEVNLSDETPLRSFALHVRPDDQKTADAWIAGLLARLGARAFDTAAEHGIFQA